MSQTALVVGASGIVGSTITQVLIDNNWHVAALSRHPAQAQGDQAFFDVFDKLRDSHLIP
jgi:uncharacterized protein YbjT (DUF2867 family)